MPSLGEILENLHTAWDRLQSAQGTMHLWYEPERTRRAYESWRHASSPGSIQPLRESATHDGASLADAQIGAPVEEYFNFWVAKPWRWRVERSVVEGGGQVGEPRSVFVINDAVWWSWTVDDHVHTNARAAHPEEREHSGVDRALLVMLDPAPLLGTLRMHTAGSAEELGRQCDVVQGTARDSQIDPGYGRERTNTTCS